MKNEKINEQKNEQDDLAAIGIGAMIVFIALILVAAVASAVIIQTGEKLQQNAQAAGEGTKDAMATKISIINVVKSGATEVTVTMELSPGSDSIDDDADIHWKALCSAGSTEGDMATAATDRSGRSDPCPARTHPQAAGQPEGSAGSLRL